MSDSQLDVNKPDIIKLLQYAMNWLSLMGSGFRGTISIAAGYRDKLNFSATVKWNSTPKQPDKIE